MPNDPKFDREQAERVLLIGGLDAALTNLAAALAHIASLENPVLPEAVERVCKRLERTGRRSLGSPVAPINPDGPEAATMLRSLAAEIAALKAMPEDGKRAELVKWLRTVWGEFPRSMRSEFLEAAAMLESDARQPASMASAIREITLLAKFYHGERSAGLFEALAILAKHGTPAPERDGAEPVCKESLRTAAQPAADKVADDPKGGE
jgi:hypothetical protein